MILRLRSSILLKMALLVAGGTSVVFALVLTYSYTYSRRIILYESEKNARNLAFSVASKLGQELRSVEKIPRNLACILETSPINEEMLGNLLRCTVEKNQEIFGSGIAFEPYALAPSKKVYCPYCCRFEGGVKLMELGSLDYHYFPRDWYHIPRELKTALWSQPYFDEGGGGILMATYSCPFFSGAADESGEKLQGIVAADVSLNWLTRLVSSIEIGRNGYCFILSDTGTFVTHPKHDLIMRESMFSLAEERKEPALREMGRLMIRHESGFHELNSSLTNEDSYVAFARIPSTGWVLGAVFAKSELLSDVSALHRTNVMLAVLGILLLALVAMFVSRSLARPLRRMARAAEKVALGDLSLDLSDIRTTDEVGQLAQAFSRMTEGLKDRDFIRDTFGRYLTKEVVNRLLESKDGLRLGGEARELTLMMSDLRGFSAMTSKMHPERVITFLNRYLGKMVEILLDHRGTIDEIIGDGILAFFGAPEPLEDHQARAVACALEMQKAMGEINALNQADGFPHLEMGVAVHTGKVVVGNIGSERRSKYGAVGSEVNFAGRIEGYTVGGQVLISEATYRPLSAFIDVKNVMKVQMKGFQDAVTLYDVTGIHGTSEVKLQQRDETLAECKERIPVGVQRLSGKTVEAAEARAWITHACATGVRLITAVELDLWENVRLLLPDETINRGSGEMYGKVVDVAGFRDKREVTIRFTSVSSDVYERLLR